MQSQTFHIGGDGGISIAAEATGNADALPVLLAHGGGQTRHTWKRVTADLANAGFRPIAIDMRGHGDSEWSAEGAYETRDFASDLVAIASKMDRKPALVGASLGGLAGLIAEGHLAPGRFASRAWYNRAVTAPMDRPQTAMLETAPEPRRWSTTTRKSSFSQ